MALPNPRALLRPGLDPNDASWRIVRYQSDWDAAELRGLSVDPVRGTIELEPEIGGASLSELRAQRVARDGHGNLFASSPNTDEILVTLSCESEPRVLCGVGGRGIASGQLRGPEGLDVDERGFLFIADADNHRVQVAALSDGRRTAEIVAVLGSVDGWGQPLAGESGGAMIEPVDVAVHPGRCWVFVADREGGQVHIFDHRFEHVCSVVPEPSGGRPPGNDARPAAIAIDSSGIAWIADENWPRLLRIDADGQALADGLASAADNPLADLALAQRFQGYGEAVIGPLDGGVLDAAWHEVLLDADLPSGTSICVQTYAANDDLTPLALIDAAAELPWAPARPVPLTTEDLEAKNIEGEVGRLVLSDTSGWHRETHGAYRRRQPVLARYNGSGPTGGTTVRVAADPLGAVRVGDSVELVIGPGFHQATVSSIPGVAFSATFEGAPVLFGPGTEVLIRLLGDAPRLISDRVIHTLGATESIDLSGSATGAAVTGSLPHAVAAITTPGDVIELRSGSSRAQLWLSRVEIEDADISITPAVAGDFSTSQLILRTTPGRLLVDDFDGFEHGSLSEVSIEVRSASAREPATVVFADTNRRALWLEPGSLGPAVTETNWTELAASAVTSDRGRYLWVRLVVRGDRSDARTLSASATPTIRSLRVLLERHSYLRYLPRTYSRRDDRRDPSGALFLERYLALFEERMTLAEAALESVSRLLNPEAATPEWLAFVGTWLGLVFDPSWPIERRRQLVLEANQLYAQRGTVSGLLRYVEIYTGRRPTVLEGFAARPAASLVVGSTNPLGCSTLGELSAAAATAPELRSRYAHRFTLFAYLEDRCDAEVAEPALHSILGSVIPAHTDYDLCLVTSDMRVGIQSTVGLDTVLADREPTRTLLGVPDADGASVLGSDFEIGNRPGDFHSRETRLDGGARIDDDLSLN